MDIKKHELLKKIANLLEDYEEETGVILGVELDFSCDENLERHIYTGESFHQTVPETKDTIINAIPCDEITRCNLKHVLHGELTPEERGEPQNRGLSQGDPIVALDDTPFSQGDPIEKLR